MKKITLFTILLFTIFSCSSISPSNLNYFSKKTGGNVQNTREQMDGIASWYGPNFHNKKTANGEIYNQNAYTVAHRILPLGSIIKITNLENSKKIFNDRGLFLNWSFKLKNFYELFLRLRFFYLKIGTIPRSNTIHLLSCILDIATSLFRKII